MNKQRQEIYAFRQETLTVQDSLDLAADLLHKAISTLFAEFSEESPEAKEAFRATLMSHYPVHFSEDEWKEQDSSSLEEYVYTKVLEEWERKCSMEEGEILNFLNPEKSPNQVLREVVRNLIVRKIDTLWQEHLLAVDHLRADVHLRVVGQKDPLMEFKQEAFLLFASFSNQLYQEIARDLFRFAMIIPQEKVLEKLRKEAKGKKARSKDSPLIPFPQG